MIITVMLLIPKSIKNIFLAVLLTNLYELMINLTNKLFFTEEQIQPIFKQFLKKLNIAKKQ